ncbi:MAG TPA: DNA-binding response regulator, partial [Alcanivorax sp.]|nr:DNA-binding response regulator [Alcanivorax sp.]
DDYLTKPFHPDELLLRVQAVLRRSHGSSGGGRLEAGGLALDEARQSVWDGDREMELTGAEFRMLRYFMLNPDRLLSKAALTEHLYDGESERDSNVVEVHVNRLRRKLGRDTIQTRRGQGYLFVGHGAA